MKTSSTKRAQADSSTSAATARAKGVSGAASASPKAVPSPKITLQKTNAWWPYAAAFLGVLVAAFLIYDPSMNGPFVWDDIYLPFMVPTASTMPLMAWLGVRPLLMGTFLFNYKVNGLEPYWYHAFNVVFHAINTLLVFFIVRKMLSWVNETGTRRDVLAGFAAAIFLVHPVQTESVSYVAGRSEDLSVMLFLAAFAVFIYRRHQTISVREVIGVLALFVCAAATKEHTVALPGLLLLTDYWFNPGFSFEGIKKNWKLYVPIIAGAMLGVVYVINILRHADSAGFKMGISWTDYLFTEFRAIWVYLRLFVVPANQNLDYDFPWSHSIVDHGAIIGLIGLVGLAVVAWIYRRRFPLASFGYFGFLLLLAPTSSFIPVKDPVVEHRLYLPFICLTLIVVDLVRRWKTSTGTLAATASVVSLVFAFLAFQRAHVWASTLDLWTDSASKSPQKARPHFQLAYAEWQNGRCGQAAADYEKVSTLQRPDASLYIDWALALDCAGDPNGAIAKLRQAAQLDPSALAYSQIGMEYGKQGKVAESNQALDEAQRIDPGFMMTYVFRGDLYATQNDWAKAMEQYTKATTIDPSSDIARQKLAVAQQRVGASH